MRGGNTSLAGPKDSNTTLVAEDTEKTLQWRKTQLLKKTRAPPRTIIFLAMKVVLQRVGSLAYSEPLVSIR